MREEPFVPTMKEALLIEEWNNLDDKVFAGFTTRNGGVSEAPFDTLNLGLHVQDDPEAVIKNRMILANEIGALDTWVIGEQVHQIGIKKVGKADQGKGSRDLWSSIPGVDGLYTSEPGLVLAAFYADCVPLYFYAPKQGLLGIAHAGWRGTVLGMASEFVKTWIEHEGVSQSDIYAAIGPAIGHCCYEVDEKVVEQVDLVAPLPNKRPYTPSREGHYYLDLVELNEQLLIKAGIKQEKILKTGYCTSCNRELFFSHRRDGGNTGRMLGFIGLKEA